MSASKLSKGFKEVFLVFIMFPAMPSRHLKVATEIQQTSRPRNGYNASQVSIDLIRALSWSLQEAVHRRLRAEQPVTEFFS